MGAVSLLVACPAQEAEGRAVRFVAVSPTGAHVVWADDGGAVVSVDLSKVRTWLGLGAFCRRRQANETRRSCTQEGGKSVVVHVHGGAVTCMAVDWAGMGVVTGAQDALLKMSRIPHGV
jgi:hypothetical protein